MNSNRAAEPHHNRNSIFNLPINCWDYFNKLLIISSMPKNRFLNSIPRIGKHEEYTEKSIENLNNSDAMTVMCRDTISIDWRGYPYDCDYNPQFELGKQKRIPDQVRDFDFQKI
jgi:hypothetical protein